MYKVFKSPSTFFAARLCHTFNTFMRCLGGREVDYKIVSLIRNKGVS